MNHLSGTAHMPQNFRNQPPRRHNDYQYHSAPPPLPHHHQQHHHHHHVPIQNPGPPPQPHHMSYTGPYYSPYHHPMQPQPQQQQHHHPQQWYPSYHIYPPPLAPAAVPAAPPSHPPPPATTSSTRQFHPLPTPQQPPQPPQHTLTQQQPLIVSSHLHTQHVPPQLVSPSTTPTSNSIAPSSSSVTASKPSSTAPDTASPSLAAPPAPVKRMPYYPELPWLSVPEEYFPPKTRRRRRRKPTAIPAEVELPSRPQEQPNTSNIQDLSNSQSSTTPSAPDTETDTVSASSTTRDAISTGQTTPSSALPPAPTSNPQPTATHKRTTTKPVVPAVPILPINKTTPKSNITSPPPVVAQLSETTESKNIDEVLPVADDATTVAPAPSTKLAPKSWAELLRSRGTASNGISPTSQAPSSAVVNGSALANATSLADVLRLYSVGEAEKISFVEPRGLVNTGNTCYMNSILQILLFCVPFYDFLDQVSKRMVHNFKSETPLIEAMIMFMREYPVIDSARSVEQLRLRLKDNELEQYGEPFVPEYVYEVIKRLPRFSTMRRGHQQDAEEFLGFLLEGLHDECVHVMKGSSPDSQSQNASEAMISSSAERSGSTSSAENGWMEVGPKQKAAVTRSSGSVLTESPITKIFGGKLRSVLRVPGLKDSVMLEPYKPLQLDIGAPNITNITDALKNLTRPETLQGEFNSPRGPGTTATRQVFIETLPPVLILHLKRFHYDNNLGTTQKIWKKVGYPLELEIPKEDFPQNQRAALSIRPGGLPKYRLIGVVYHHGRTASGGHYTVDIRRQEGREWIRIDDTVIRRVRTEDVAAEGGEEDPKILAKALEQHKNDQDAGKDNTLRSMGFGSLNNEESMDGNNHDEDVQGGWSQVNGNPATSPTSATTSGKKWSSVANGDVTPKSGEHTSGRQTPRGGTGSKFSTKDNKVAYILFYQQTHP